MDTRSTFESLGVSFLNKIPPHFDPRLAQIHNSNAVAAIYAIAVLFVREDSAQNKKAAINQNSVTSTVRLLEDTPGLSFTITASKTKWRRRAVVGTFDHII